MNKTLKSSVLLGQSYQCNLVRMERPELIWLREEGRTEDYYKMKSLIQYHFQSIKSTQVLEVEPVKVIKSGSIFGIKTKDNGWARARVLSSN